MVYLNILTNLTDKQLSTAQGAKYLLLPTLEKKTPKTAQHPPEISDIQYPILSQRQSSIFQNTSPSPLPQ
jgi:hypothetical protein